MTETAYSVPLAQEHSAEQGTPIVVGFCVYDTPVLQPRHPGTELCGPLSQIILHTHFDWVRRPDVCSDQSGLS